jgi:hypothetical protein
MLGFASPLVGEVDREAVGRGKPAHYASVVYPPP